MAQRFAHKPVSWDTDWARQPWARVVREVVLCGVLRPLIRLYTRPRVLGAEHLARVRGPVVLAVRHASHLDTPLVMSHLPRQVRRRTAVVAAADYFFRARWMAAGVSLAFATVPIERTHLSPESTARIRRIFDAGWNLLVFPEGTRTRTGELGRLRAGAAAFAVAEKCPLVPVWLEGTFEAMPVGSRWARHHPVTVAIGPALHAEPGEGPQELTARLRAAFTDLAVQARAAGGS